MPAEFNYPAHSINKINHVLDFKQSQDVLRVPKFSPDNPAIERVYTDFYYILKNPVTPLVQDVPDESEEALEGDLVELVTYSKLELKKEKAIFITSGANKVVETISGIDYWFIKLPLDFSITTVEQWSIGGSAFSTIEVFDIDTETTTTEADVYPIYPFIPARAYDYGNDFTESAEGGFTTAPVTLLDVHNAWAAKVTQLLAVKYP